MNLVRKFIKDERGSLSLLIMSLFLITLILLAILTDISSMYLAKRSLTQATEAAAQRGGRNLDLDNYYRGEYNFNRFQLDVMGMGQTDPGIPIDCSKGVRDAVSTLHDWSNGGPSIKRRNMSEISLVDVRCNGYEISLRTSSVVKLPFVLPFIGLDRFTIYSSIGSIDQRKQMNNR
jgi:hypothetical protein